MKPTRIVGIDPGLVKMAVATPAGTETLRNTLRDEPRLVYLRDTVENFVRAPGTVVVMEGYNHGAKRGATSLSQLAELGGVLKVMMHEVGTPWTLVAPATLKLFATGSGKGKPAQVLEAAQRELDYEGKSEDEATALWLRQMGLQAYRIKSKDRIGMEAKRVDHILEVVKWPSLA